MMGIWIFQNLDRESQKMNLNLQQVLSNVETSSSSKETTSQVIEGYMFLGIVAIYVLCPLKKPIGYTQHLGDSSEESCTELAVFFKYIL